MDALSHDTPIMIVGQLDEACHAHAHAAWGHTARANTERAD